MQRKLISLYMETLSNNVWNQQRFDVDLNLKHYTIENKQIKRYK